MAEDIADISWPLGSVDDSGVGAVPFETFDSGADSDVLRLSVALRELQAVFVDTQAPSDVLHRSESLVRRALAELNP